MSVADSAGSIIDSLYEQFLLRDFTAKIVPGALTLASVFVASGEPTPSLYTLDRIPFPLWFGVAGASWIVGFVVQGLGQRSGLIRLWPASVDDRDLRYERRLDFSRLATEQDRRQVERFAVIKEAAGNAASAAAVAAIVILLGAAVGTWGTSPQIGQRITSLAVQLGWVLGSLIVVALVLRAVNREHALKEYGFMDQVIDRGAKEGNL